MTDLEQWALEQFGIRPTDADETPLSEEEVSILARLIMWREL